MQRYQAAAHRIHNSSPPSRLTISPPRPGSLLCHHLLHATAGNRVTPNLKTTATNLLVKKENHLIDIDLFGTADALGQALSIEITQ